jgi:poly(A) polymerase
LLGLEPKDYDVATDAVPQRVLEIFPRGRKVGAKFGVILVRKFGHDIEVATFRTEHGYTDGRRPDRVVFGTAEDDARRRDFTINGLFFDPVESRVIDFVGGQADLQARLLRTIGVPHQRFAEDHLRMLRAVRFAARLSLVVDAETLRQIQAHAAELARISPERIRMELEAILEAPSRGAGWELLSQAGLRPHLCAAWPCTPTQSSAELARVVALPRIPLPFTTALAAAACDRSCSELAALASGLRLSNKQAETLSWLTGSLGELQRNSSLELADLKLLLSRPEWQDLLTLLESIASLTGTDPGAARMLRRRAAAIPRESVAPLPWITGDDLIAMGYAAGPELGRALAAVYRAQLSETVKSREDALRLARDLLDAHREAT